ncbi:hypothetical protein HDA40_004453 [Hamadaea flava]|nr:hypothetical protein [Hamadaea flava]MCP2325946.1 hypothetical protein [Hamadaea flava]
MDATGLAYALDAVKLGRVVKDDGCLGTRSQLGGSRDDAARPRLRLEIGVQQVNAPSQPSPEFAAYMLLDVIGRIAHSRALAHRHQTLLRRRDLLKRDGISHVRRWFSDEIGPAIPVDKPGRLHSDGEVKPPVDNDGFASLSIIELRD